MKISLKIIIKMLLKIKIKINNQKLINNNYKIKNKNELFYGPAKSDFFF